MQATRSELGDDAKTADGHPVAALGVSSGEPEEPAASRGAGALPAARGSVGRPAVWLEILGTWWLGLPVVLSALGAAEYHFGWQLPGAGPADDERWVWLLVVLVLASLLA